jgi:site-specific DNA-cytosine methylase
VSLFTLSEVSLVKLLELFSGTGCMSQAFINKEFQAFSIDFNPVFAADLCVNIMEVTPEMIVERFGKPDVVWASPDCTAFSIASVSHNWHSTLKGYIPKREFAAKSLKALEYTLWLIKQLNPRLFFIENPRGMMRKMPVMQEFPRYTVTYCQYGDIRMKPTDIWTNHNNPCFKPMCKNGSGCHEAAPRGSKTGTQGLKNSVERAKIPLFLCEHIANISFDYLSKG